MNLTLTYRAWSGSQSEEFDADDEFSTTMSHLETSDYLVSSSSTKLTQEHSTYEYLHLQSLLKSTAPTSTSGPPTASDFNIHKLKDMIPKQLYNF